MVTAERPRQRSLRADALVDHQEFKDTGCEVAPSCFACPLPKCRFEMSAGEAKRELAAWRLSRVNGT